MRPRTMWKAALAIGASSIGLGLVGSTASATEGYFQPGYSAVQKSLSGTGVANPEDAMTLAINPAGLTSVGQEFEAGISYFSPYRQYTVTGGPGFVAPGTVKSGQEHFGIPGLAYSHPIDADSSWGVAIYANGGMNTSYPGSTPNPACGPFSGVYCGFKTGVNMNQLFVSVGYARKHGDWSFGVAPIFAIQQFSAKGLGAFAPISASPANLTNNESDYTYGAGVRAGAIWTVSPTVRVGISAATPIWMTKIKKYKGLFVDGGSFDIPWNVSAGVAWDATPDVTLMADYKRIFYSSVPSVGRSTLFTGAPLGSANGPGFGWKDVNVVSLGGEWRASPQWTVRAGYAHNDNPIGSADVTLNILAPGVITDHFSGGVSYKLTDRDTIDLTGLYAPKHSVSGIEVTPFGPNPGRTITLSMHQYDVTVGYRRRF